MKARGSEKMSEKASTRQGLRSLRQQMWNHSGAANVQRSSSGNVSAVKSVSIIVQPSSARSNRIRGAGN